MAYLTQKNSYLNVEKTSENNQQKAWTLIGGIMTGAMVLVLGNAMMKSNSVDKSEQQKWNVVAYQTEYFQSSIR